MNGPEKIIFTTETNKEVRKIMKDATMNIDNNKSWCHVKDAVKGSAKKTIGFVDNTARKQWVTTEMLEKMDE